MTLIPLDGRKVTTYDHSMLNDQESQIDFMEAYLNPYALNGIVQDQFRPFKLQHSSREFFTVFSVLFLNEWVITEIEPMENLGTKTPFIIRK